MNADSAQLINNSILDLERERLQRSLLEFTKTFFYLRTGRTFNVSQPFGRKSHIIIICNALIKVISGETNRLIINVPPRYGKTELLINFIAWAISQYPDSNFLYVSYGLGLAKKQTKTVRDIVAMPHYRDLFGVSISEDVSAQGNFETSKGGTIYAAGAEGEIMGRGAGIKGSDRFGGAAVIDDIHKPVEVTSDTMRTAVIDWYENTFLSRLNNPSKTPIIFVGQLLHEDDLGSRLRKSKEWTLINLPAIDQKGYALDPTMHTIEQLRHMQETMPYVFAAQYQQDPLPAGGAIFKKEDFVITPTEPQILSTFITVDTAETTDKHNDATVFSFWGIYKVTHFDRDTDTYALHWLDCEEDWIEPKDLQSRLLDFYASCMSHRCKPKIIIIEKKSTGVTLSSSIKTLQGIRAISVNRNKSKADRFLEAQPFVSSRQISLPFGAKHTEQCIEHCSKITANDSHRRDDIADTMYDAIKAALIDKIIVSVSGNNEEDNDTARMIMSRFTNVARAKGIPVNIDTSRNTFGIKL